jgi:glycosyltransferase A (GT-A) superfamily protein (DUF2064 family)
MRAYVEKIKAVDKRMPIQADLIKKIDYYDLDATKQDIQNWQESRIIAQQTMNPDWTDYIRVCDDIMLDGHLTGRVFEGGKSHFGIV